MSARTLPNYAQSATTPSWTPWSVGAPLRFVPSDKMFVAGLVSSKDSTLETPAVLIQRITEASTYAPLDRLALRPRCGFASTAAGNLLSEVEQWLKLEPVAETARYVWGG